jgi:hypothetical protein
MKTDLKKICLPAGRKKLFLFKLPWMAARHAFLACIAIFLISFLIGVVIFSKNYFSIQVKKAEVVEDKSYFNERSYSQLLIYWQENEKRFNEADSKIYPNPFMLTEEKK